MSGRGMNGDVRNRRGGSKSRLLSPPPSGVTSGGGNTSATISSQIKQDCSLPKVRGSSAERLLSPPPVTSPGAVNGHHGKFLNHKYYIRDRKLLISDSYYVI